ncbi:hypothetical protein BHE74_00007098 [Ensete ventricosum]|nr:hypothetical protein BHE74_00007098 [Ensete ventricosum]
MPIGLFPEDATNYEFNEETGKLAVFIPSVCEVGYKDSSVLRFFTTVTGYLEKGKLADIEGIKTKVLIWVKVSCVSTEGTKVHFATGLKKTRSRDAYEVKRWGGSPSLTPTASSFPPPPLSIPPPVPPPSPGGAASLPPRIGKSGETLRDSRASCSSIEV